MKKIVILGNSSAIVKLIETIREKDKSSDITLISFDDYLPYRQDLIPDYISKEISIEELTCKTKEFYSKNNVNLIFNKKITRINFNRNKIFTEEKEQIDYDLLVLTDLPIYRFPDIKGTNKSGVYELKKLKNIDDIIKELPFIDTIVIQAESMRSIKFASAFVKRGKEVIFVIPHNTVFSSEYLDDLEKPVLKIFEKKRIKIINNNSIAEILGDGDLKAVRLKSGKVFSTQIVIFENVRQDYRIVSETEIKINDKICVNSFFKTDKENVYAIGEIIDRKVTKQTESFLSYKELEFQGKMVGLSILSDEKNENINKDTGINNLEGEKFIEINSINLEDFSATFLGKTAIEEGTIINKMVDLESNVCKIIFCKNDCCVGAILVNADSEEDKILNLINSNISISNLEYNILEGPLDKRNQDLKENEPVADKNNEINDTKDEQEVDSQQSFSN